MIRTQDIVYEEKTYWVLKVAEGYEVYRKGVTHSVRVSQIDFTGPKGLNRAISDCKNRAKNETRQKTKTKKGE